MNCGRRKLVRSTVMTIGFIAIVVGVRIWYLEEQGNFHPVSPGAAYRSAQQDRDELDYVIRKFKIGSIINLMGEHADEPWYEEEISTCRELGIDHFDLGLSAEEAPSSCDIEELLRLFHDAPRPVLIHCKWGADRSGLASALWKLEVDGEPVSVARKQFSILYGHLPFRPTQVLDEFFDTWVSKRKMSEIGRP